jgi:prevent-host-death family protein
VSTFVDVREAKARLSQLLDRARAGEEIVIVKSGKPYAKLIALKKQDERVPGLAKGRVTDAFFDPLPLEERDAWEK